MSDNIGALLDLAKRCEDATVYQQREMLDLAFRAIHGEKPPRVHGGSPELSAWLNLHNPFYGKLAVYAFESAAMTLVPEGRDFGAGSRDATCRAWAWVGEHLAPGAVANAVTPALALTAAALRARAAQGTEAQRAETVEQGSVHDVPVGEADAPNPSISSQGS